MNKELKKGFIEYILWISVFTMIIVPIVNVSAFSYRYYAGYYFYGDDYDFAPIGIRADIYTIEPSFSGKSDFYAEWVCIILDYDNGYWVQLGYTGYWIETVIIPIFWIEYDFEVDFYIEKADSAGHSISFMGEPDEGDTYRYKLWNEDLDNDYDYRILEGNVLKRSGEISIVAADKDPVDSQCFVETTTDDIAIDDSHVDEISYLGVFSYTWYYWYMHEGLVDSPYSLTETYDYEFSASGGG